MGAEATCNQLWTTCDHLCWLVKWREKDLLAARHPQFRPRSRHLLPTRLLPSTLPPLVPGLSIVFDKTDVNEILNFIENFKDPLDEQPKGEPNFGEDADPDFHLLAQGANSDS